MHKLRAHNAYILKCLISPDCQQLATTSSDKTVKLWNLDDNFRLDRTLTGHTRWVSVAVEVLVGYADQHNRFLHMQFVRFNP